MQKFFVPNISNENDPIHFECDDSFDSKTEILKYSVQFFYLSIGAYLNAVLVFTIWFKHRNFYKQNSFFVLFSTDCLVSLILILIDIFFYRLFIYVTPICPIVHEYFATPLVFSKFIMILIHHLKICKSLLQSLLVLNRMTSVLFPIYQNIIWMKNFQWIIPLIFLIPISVDWNLVISRVYMMPTYGGLWMNYIKKVSWASQSTFQLIFIFIALSFTIICTCITLYTLIMLPNRLKDLEKSITIVNVITSTAFATVGFFHVSVYKTATYKNWFQILFSFFSFNTMVTSVFAWTMFAYDVLNVGSPIVMLCISKLVREHVFSWSKVLKVGSSQNFPVSVTQ
ncbi:hypothetical protein CAEBREN_30198 [Caenorhabditis brenneri]|uniref:Serpentine receptor class gamma n=1 Tax=Caenorhabditis brenneri TaxID=135651 RepID=G0PC30_CAEBE|nr:hypothetical protein CAEBREN_30198 [Caenorhabditis brenneri]